MRISLRKWWEDKHAIVMVMVSVILRVAALFFSAWNVRQLSITITSGFNDICENVMLLGILVLLGMLCSTIGQYAASHGEYHLFTSLIDEYVDKELDGDYNMFLKFSTAKVITVSDNLWKITKIGRLLEQMIAQLSEIIIVVGAIWYITPTVILPILVIYIIGAVILKYAFASYSKIDKAVNKSRIWRSELLEESINGFAEVRSFVQQERYKRELHENNHATNKLFTKRKLMDVVADGAIDLTHGFGTVIGVVVAIIAIRDGVITVTEGLAIVMYVQRLINPLSWMLSLTQELSDSTSMLDEYQQIIEYENITSDDGNIHLDDFHDSIEIRDLSFAYNSSDEVLSHINIKIPKGSKIGICGESGGGKTTLFNLLQKFYNPTSGSILIDGMDYQDVETNSLRSQIGMVHQDTFILDGTFRDNIRFGKWNATDYEIIDACKKANIYDFIQKKPEGFDTNVGPRGLKLSGGQKQRIALARLFLVNPDIILLDEATSSLDNTSESVVQEVIDSFKDKTIITIAHRLTTIQGSDTIYVLKNSKVVESGTHEELMRKGGEYEKLYRKNK